MFAKECLACGGRFDAKREAAKYCSGRCRQRAHVAPERPPARREGAPLVTLAPKPQEEDPEGFAAGTRRELEAAGRLDSYLGRSAMHLAKVVDANVGDTGSGHAALIREYKASMAAALDGAQQVESPLERIRRTRESKAG